MSNHVETFLREWDKWEIEDGKTGYLPKGFAGKVAVLSEAGVTDWSRFVALAVADYRTKGWQPFTRTIAHAWLWLSAVRMDDPSGRAERPVATIEEVPEVETEESPVEALHAAMVMEAEPTWTTRAQSVRARREATGAKYWKATA